MYFCSVLPICSFNFLILIWHHISTFCKLWSKGCAKLLKKRKLLKICMNQKKHFLPFQGLDKVFKMLEILLRFGSCKCSYLKVVCPGNCLGLLYCTVDWKIELLTCDVWNCVNWKKTFIRCIGNHQFIKKLCASFIIVSKQEQKNNLIVLCTFFSGQ